MVWIPPMAPRDDRPDGARAFVSLRDRIAIKHLREAAKHSGNEDEVARACYRMADAMLKAREER